MKKQKGITLIALVITIIVLLILAVVTIVTLTGDNGLLTKAEEAQKQSIIGEEKEKISLGHLDYQAVKSMGKSENLSVEGATVTGNGNPSWTIEFNKTKDKFLLKKDGKIEFLDEKTENNQEVVEETTISFGDGDLHVGKVVFKVSEAENVEISVR